jgi:hypothetical protein
MSTFKGADFGLGEDFDLETGLRDAYDIVIDAASFAFDPAYNNGNTMLLILQGHDEEGNVVQERLSVGGDWSTADGGHTIQHPKGKARINQISIYGHWIRAAASCPGFPEAAKAVGLTPLRSDGWNNMVFHLEARELEFGSRNKRNEQSGPGTVTRLLPVAFLGIYDEASGLITPVGVPSPQLPTQPQPASVPPAATNGTATPGANTLIDQLTALAKTSPTHGDFLGKAISIPGVTADDNLVAAIGNPNGFYAEHHR